MRGRRPVHETTGNSLLAHLPGARVTYHVLGRNGGQSDYVSCTLRVPCVFFRPCGLSSSGPEGRRPRAWCSETRFGAQSGPGKSARCESWRWVSPMWFCKQISDKAGFAFLNPHGTSVTTWIMQMERDRPRHRILLVDHNPSARQVLRSANMYKHRKGQVKQK